MRDDVEEFAALLRGLKERTDRSYGSLARRVHMNTSTLHRYCAGEAVPQEFAPVERLAVFCGATPQERLELHRLWLSAVVDRQRARTAGSAGATVPEPESEPGADPEPDGPLVEAGSSAEQPGDDPDPLSPALAGAPRLPNRRRRALASAAVACALLAALGIVFALSDDGSSEADASRPAAPWTTAPGAPRHSAKPPASPSSPSRSSASPSPRQRTTPPSPTSGDLTSAVKPATDLPLTWSTDSLVWDKGCGHDYVIDKPPAQVPPPPVEQDAGAWASTQGAVHGRRTMVQISVQGRSSTAVVLEALRVRVVGRGNPAAGSAYSMEQGCGGELTPRRFTVDLDVDRPVARPKDGADRGRTMPAVRFPYRVSAEDPEVLLVDATTQTCDARWYLELDWSSQGRTGTIRIDDNGRPFRTTSIKGMPRYWYGTNDADMRAWVPVPS
ncbi:helix-turn-helix transcriptional regulator [Streptomyces sp. AM 2-1-1]|uniref:helix-turn-helix domain-containing protein n=1 Tax=Streptomyces sp. AM 2-1-1 TaxID=3028709 RepID=UPI0023B89881|nr:helix-turn-helix transcriptional regulator [Streptomyces sp. AM 2-1-1]WEH43513.1 helix-turn-helix transcriptional regulator [Streptomyces sp. AM 2-1-1]WEH43934.1 helix-turn-helix transcriptional regulator [Streptomyces sp. AM 2-1-1]